MRSAARLYRLGLGLGGLGLAAIGLALAGALEGLRLNPGLPGALLSACGNVLPALGPAGYLQLGLGLLAGVCLARAARGVARQLRATRAYLRELGPAGERVEVAGEPCLLLACSEPRALCAGYLRPRVYLSRGAIEALEPDELRAVIAHERHHRERRDPLRLLVARVLAEALFFLPALGPISVRYAELVEIAADEAAVRALGERRTLARALLRFGEVGQPAVAVAAIAPERVDHLSGEPGAAGWRLPAGAVIASVLVAMALLAGIGLFLGAERTPVNLLLVLAQSCVLMIVAAAVATSAAGGALRRLVGRARG